MDQSKWSIPRYRGMVQTKSFQKLERPRLKIQGVWAHNIVLTLNVIEARLASDASTVIEALLRTLEKVNELCAAKNKPPPKKVFIFVT